MPRNHARHMGNCICGLAISGEELRTAVRRGTELVNLCPCKMLVHEPERRANEFEVWEMRRAISDLHCAHFKRPFAADIAMWYVIQAGAFPCQEARMWIQF